MECSSCADLLQVLAWKLPGFLTHNPCGTGVGCLICHLLL